MLDSLTTPIPNVPKLSASFPFHNLQALVLKKCYFQNSQHLLHFLCNFPHLNSLSIQRLEEFLDHEAIVQDLPLRATGSLSNLYGNLHISESNKFDNDKSILGIVNSLPGRSGFRSVFLNTRARRESIEELNFMLRACGLRLKKLNLFWFGIQNSRTSNSSYIIFPCTNNCVAQSLPNIIDLSDLSELRYLDVPMLSSFRTTPAEWLLDTLSTITSPLLERVRIPIQGVWNR